MVSEGALPLNVAVPATIRTPYKVRSIYVRVYSVRHTLLVAWPPQTRLAPLSTVTVDEGLKLVVPATTKLFPKICVLVTLTFHVSFTRGWHTRFNVECVLVVWRRCTHFETCHGSIHIHIYDNGYCKNITIYVRQATLIPSWLKVTVSCAVGMVPLSNN